VAPHRLGKEDDIVTEHERDGITSLCLGSGEKTIEEKNLKNYRGGQSLVIRADVTSATPGRIKRRNPDSLDGTTVVAEFAVHKKFNMPLVGQNVVRKEVLKLVLPLWMGFRGRSTGKDKSRPAEAQSLSKSCGLTKLVLLGRMRFSMSSDDLAPENVLEPVWMALRSFPSCSISRGRGWPWTGPERGAEVSEAKLSCWRSSGTRTCGACHNQDVHW
jgi:hypothetical protein